MSERLELINYMDVHVFTYDNEHKKLICQIESIDKIRNINAIDLIIFDEIASILTHIKDRTEGL